MFRLPVCPHCGTVYRYRDTKDAMKQRENTCYHCKKKFRAALMPYVLIEALALAAVCVVVNILLLKGMKELSLIPLFAVTVVFILLIYLLYPFFLRFKIIEEDVKTNDKEKAKKTTKK